MADHLERRLAACVAEAFLPSCVFAGLHMRTPQDIKPANVLLADEGHAVLMDFGSAAPARVHVTSRKHAMTLMVRSCCRQPTSPAARPNPSARPNPLTPS